MATSTFDSTRESVVGNGATAQLRQVASNVKDELNKAGHIAKEVTQEQMQELGKAGTEQLDKVAKYVRERPLTALLIGGAVGFVAASLTRRS